jgi:hypothetical protein
MTNMEKNSRKPKMTTISGKIMSAKKVTIKKDAREAGMTVSEYLRWILDNPCKGVSQSMISANSLQKQVSFTPFSNGLGNENQLIRGYLTVIKKQQDMILKNNRFFYGVMFGVVILGCICMVAELEEG